MSEKILRRPAVQEMVGLSRSTIYALIAANQFPKPVRLGSRAVGWLQSDLTAWLEARETA